MKILLALLGIANFAFSTTISTTPPEATSSKEIKSQANLDVETWRKSLVDAKKKLDSSRK